MFGVGTEGEEDFKEVFEYAAIVNVNQGFATHIWCCASVFEFIERNGSGTLLFGLLCQEGVAVAVDCAPFESFVCCCATTDQPQVVPQKAIYYQAYEDSEHEKCHNRHCHIHQVLEDVTFRRLLNQPFHISIVP